MFRLGRLKRSHKLRREIETLNRGSSTRSSCTKYGYWGRHGGGGGGSSLYTVGAADFQG